MTVIISEYLVSKPFRVRRGKWYPPYLKGSKFWQRRNQSLSLERTKNQKVTSGNCLVYFICISSYFEILFIRLIRRLVEWVFLIISELIPFIELTCKSYAKWKLIHYRYVLQINIHPCLCGVAEKHQRVNQWNSGVIK